MFSLLSSGSELCFGSSSSSTAWGSARTVSYTHLDVYKRQKVSTMHLWPVSVSKTRGVMKWVGDLRDKLGQTFVIVTHDETLAKLTDRTIHMVDGRISIDR